MATDKFNDISLVDLESIIIFFQWADDWNNPLQNFKMVWCDASGNTLEESEGTAPEQILEFSDGSPYLNGNYKLKIQSDTQPQVVELKIIFDYTKNTNNQNSNANIEYLTTSKHIFGHPIVDNVISVAAVNFNEDEVEFFSSRGPSIISNGLVTIENEQPKITGADGVSTFVWGTEGFSGTSAAAPHIAGVAAQYFSEFPNDSYSEFLFHLKSSAIPLEDGNPNHWSIKSGHGIADSYGSINHKYGSSAVYIRQLDKNDIIFGEAAWYNWTVIPEHWQNYGPFEPVTGASTIQERFRALQVFKEDTYEKYHHWNKNNSPTGNVQNHANISTTNQNELLTAKFKEVVNVLVQIALDGAVQNTGIIKFKDPWYFEQSAQYWQHPYGYRNMGMSQISEEETSPLNLYTYSNYKGVFLDQLVPDGIYYSSEVAQTQILSGKQSYFVNWSATGQTGLQGIISPNSLNTPIVFKEEGAVVSANYHAAQQSNYSNAYLNPGQRKFIKTTNQQYGNNYFHKVYESHGKVWYEMSSNGGNTWQIMNNGQPLNTGGGTAKYPSIDYSPDYYYPNQILVVFWEERLQPIHDYYITLQFYDNGVLQYESIAASNHEGFGYIVGEFSKPVVARRHPTFLVAWDSWQPGPLGWDGGIMYRLGQLGSQIYWNTDPIYVEYGWSLWQRNPTIAISKSGTGLGTYRLAWDKGSHVCGVNLEVLETGSNPPYTVRENSGYIFSQAGFSSNYQPSINVLPNNDFRMSWFGFKKYVADRSESSSALQVITWFNNQFYIFGTSPSSHSMSVTNDGKSIIAYGDQGGTRNKFRQVYYFTLEKNLNTTGVQTHLSNGTSLNDMFAMSFQNAILPFSFTMSASLSSLPKVTEIPIASGRKGIVVGDSVEFYFTLGDVTLNGNTIDFIQTGINPDFTNLDTLNYYLSTEKFNVTNSSQFNFSIEYGVTDSLNAVQSLDENEYVKFNLQLINANTNNVIGEYTVITFTKQNVIPYNGKSFSINTNGIGNRKVRVRIVVEENIGGSYAIANISAEENVLPKQNHHVISYSGSEEVTEYALEQNYPNPFNPTTKIKYQIPISGNVTIKVYDILGNEIVKLVDGYMETGRYEVNFDASNLASGVYIYRLNVNDFVNVKKMVLLK